MRHWPVVSADLRHPACRLTGTEALIASASGKPGRAMTPNEKYAALAEVAGYVPVPLPETDYIELLAVTWRTINAYGIKIGRRSYDCEELNPCRRQDSGVTRQRGPWEVRYVL